MNEKMLEMMKELELKRKPKGRYKIFVSSKEISKMTGQKRKNVIKLKDTGYDCSVYGTEDLKKYDFYIEDDLQ